MPRYPVAIWWLAPTVHPLLLSSGWGGETAPATLATISATKPTTKLVYSWRRALELTPLPISVADGRLSGALLGHHKDPFDRMLATQAEIEGLLLVTADAAFGLLGTRTLW